MIKKFKCVPVEAGTATYQKRKTSLRMNRKALLEAYAAIKKDLGKMPLSQSAFLDAARDAASTAIDKDKKKNPPKPIIIIRWKVIILTGYMYLDGALVMVTTAVVVREERPA